MDEKQTTEFLEHKTERMHAEIEGLMDERVDLNAEVVRLKNRINFQDEFEIVICKDAMTWYRKYTHAKNELDHQNEFERITVFETFVKKNFDPCRFNAGLLEGKPRWVEGVSLKGEAEFTYIADKALYDLLKKEEQPQTG